MQAYNILETMIIHDAPADHKHMRNTVEDIKLGQRRI